VAILAPGCSTLTPTQEDTLAEASSFLHDMAEGVAQLAISKKEANREIIRTVLVGLDQLILAETLDPQKVESAISPFWEKSQDLEIKLGLRAVMSGYTLFVRRFVHGTVDGNPVALSLLTAIREGGWRAMISAGETPPVLRHLKAKQTKP
jgi:hypothetical protein